MVELGRKRGVHGWSAVTSVDRGLRLVQDIHLILSFSNDHVLIFLVCECDLASVKVSLGARPCLARAMAFIRDIQIQIARENVFETIQREITYNFLHYLRSFDQYFLPSTSKHLCNYFGLLEIQCEQANTQQPSHLGPTRRLETRFTTHLPNSSCNPLTSSPLDTRSTHATTLPKPSTNPFKYRYYPPIERAEISIPSNVSTSSHAIKHCLKLHHSLLSQKS